MRQAAAFPYRRSGDSNDLELLLVTTDSGRWIIPKGDIDEGMAAHEAAEKEAFEEGGVRGEIGDEPIGSFCFRKEGNGAAISTDVDVFSLKVSEELPEWPEQGRRNRRWMPLPEAADAVEPPELRAIIASFQH